MQGGGVLAAQGWPAAADSSHAKTGRSLREPSPHVRVNLARLGGRIYECHGPRHRVEVAAVLAHLHPRGKLASPRWRGPGRGWWGLVPQARPLGVAPRKCPKPQGRYARILAKTGQLVWTRRDLPLAGGSRWPGGNSVRRLSAALWARRFRRPFCGPVGPCAAPLQGGSDWVRGPSRCRGDGDGDPWGFGEEGTVGPDSQTQSSRRSRPRRPQASNRAAGSCPFPFPFESGRRPRPERSRHIGAPAHTTSSAWALTKHGTLARSRPTAPILAAAFSDSASSPDPARSGRQPPHGYAEAACHARAWCAWRACFD